MRLPSMLLLTCVVATGCGQMSNWRNSGASATAANPLSPLAAQTAETTSPAPNVQAAIRAAEAPNGEVSRVAMLLSQLIETEGNHTGDNFSQPGSGKTGSEVELASKQTRARSPQIQQPVSDAGETLNRRTNPPESSNRSTSPEHGQLAGTIDSGRSDSNPLQSDQNALSRADETPGSAAHQLAMSNQSVGRGNRKDVSRSANTEEIPYLSNDLPYQTDESNRGPGRHQAAGIPENPRLDDSGNQREIQQLSLKIESLQERIGQQQTSSNRSSELLELKASNPNSNSSLSSDRANHQGALEHSASELTPNQIQTIAIQSAIEHEETRGWIVERVNSLERSFDLISRKPHPIDPSISIDVRFIAVHGQPESRELIVQTREVELSKEFRGDFWIYSVANCATEPRVVPIQNPSEDSLRPVYEIRHYVFDLNGGDQESRVHEKSAASKNDAPQSRRFVAIPLNQ